MERLLRKILKYQIILYLALLPIVSYAWDGSAHKVIAAIAYSQLTPAARQSIDQLTQIVDPGYPPTARFLYIAPLADRWRKTGENNGKISHFTNQPWSPDGTPTTPGPSPNLVAMIGQNISIYTSSNASAHEKAIALVYLVHLMADAHQPLHCSNRFTKEFPQGDRAGTLFWIHAPQAHTLHNYWDKAANLLAVGKWHYPLSNKHISRLAAGLEIQYPSAVFGSEVNNDNIEQWAQQCNALAQQVVYQIVPNRKPNAAYKKLVSETAARQFTLAGYRIAAFLNKVAANQEK